MEKSIDNWEWQVLEAIFAQALVDAKCNSINETTGEYDIRNNAVKWLKSKKAEQLLVNTDININYIREKAVLKEKPPLSTEKLREYLIKKYGEEFVKENEADKRVKAELMEERRKKQLEKRRKAYSDKIVLLKQGGEHETTKAS